MIRMLLYVSGRKLRELRNDNLPDHYEDISVRDDELAVAGWDNEKFLLFSTTI